MLKLSIYLQYDEKKLTYLIGTLLIIVCSSLFWYYDYIYDINTTSIVTAILLGSGSSIILVTSLTLTTELIGFLSFLNCLSIILFFSWCHTIFLFKVPILEQVKFNVWIKINFFIKQAIIKVRLYSEPCHFLIRYRTESQWHCYKNSALVNSEPFRIFEAN